MLVSCVMENASEFDIAVSDAEWSDSHDSFEEKQADDESAFNCSEKKKSKGFVCEICGRVTSSSHRLQEHLSSHTGAKHLQCEICGKKFAWRYSYKSHMVHHSSDNPNECTVCGKKFCNKSAMKNHILRKHDNPNKEYKCDKCNKEFLTNSELRRHSFNHTSEKPHMCEYCGNSYRFKSALVVHYRLHSNEKPYQCHFCDITFTHKSSAINHHKTHTEEKPFQCNICEKKFSIKRSLTSHKSVHSDRRPFKCKECGKTFRSRSGFHVHLDFHLGLKRHVCKYCGKAFRAWSNMHKHIKRHTTNKTYPCKNCDKIFSDAEEMKNHTKSHNIKKKKCTLNKQPCHINHSIDDVPDDPVPLTTDISLNECMNPTFSNQPSEVMSQPSNLSQIPNHSHMPPTNRQLFSHEIQDEKNQPERYPLLPDSYVSQYFPMSHQTDVQFVPPSLNIPNLCSLTNSNQAVNSRPPCVSDVNQLMYNNAHIVDYVNYFNLQPSNEESAKCRFCRCFFQSVLDLKQHLSIYHRIEEENLEELLK